MAWNVANFIALAVVFLTLALVSVALRFWARTKTRARFGADDVFIIPAVLCVIGIAVTMIVGTQTSDMAQHQKNEIGPHGPIYTSRLGNYEKANYALQLLPLASLGFSKVSVLCFYRRVFGIYPRFAIVNTILIVIVVAWAVSFFFATLFQCKHPRTLWTTFEYARVDCIDTLPFYYGVSISGFITDLLILASPLPIIHQLQMPLKSRIAVAGILLLGAVVCGAGIARFVTFVNIGHGIFANINDLTYFTTPVFAWTMIESSLAVVGANLPLLRPLLHQKTYTSSYAWSLLRSFRIRSSANSSRSRFSSESKRPSNDEFHLTNKSISSEDTNSASNLPDEESAKASGEGIYVERKFEVV